MFRLVVIYIVHPLRVESWQPFAPIRNNGYPLLAFRERGVGVVHDEWPPLGASVCLLDDGGAVGTNYAADGHEEARPFGQRGCRIEKNRKVRTRR